MGISSFSKGTQIIVRGKQATLLRRLDNDVWQVEDKASHRITEITRADLNALYRSSQLTFANTVSRHTSAADDEKAKPHCIATDADWEEAKVRRLYVIGTLDVPNTRKPLEEAIAAVWDKLRKPERAPDWSTVYRWKTRYLEAGKDITALLSDKARRGNRTCRYPAEVVNEVQDAIDLVYLDLTRKSVQDAVDRAKAMVNRENDLRPKSMQLAVPTRRLVTRMIRQIPAFDLYAARHGQQQAVRRFRSVLAHRTTEAPLERAEIDHSPLDLIVVDDETSLPLGRPYVTACIDDYTRCLLGLFISFEPPSHYTVARCLKHSFLPKADVKETYPGIVNDWSAHGVMRELVVDNGAEFHSASLENACYSLGIELHYSPRKTPWFKGKIERFLGTLNNAAAHGVPGTTFSNIFEKEDYDPSKFAVVRFSLLKEVVHRWVVDVYHQRPHRTTRVPPAVHWATSVHPDDILLPDDPAQLDLILGKSATRKLTHKGIELAGLTYNSPDLVQLRHRIGDSTYVDVRFDPADLGTLFVIDPNRSNSYTVPCLERAYATGISEWQHRVCKKFAARQLDKYDASGWLEAKEQIRELIANEFLHKKMQTRKKIARFRQGPSGSPSSAAQQEAAAPTGTGAVEIASPSTMPTTAEKVVPPEPTSNQFNANKDGDRNPTQRPEDTTDPVTNTSPPQNPSPKKYKPIVRVRSVAATLEDNEHENRNE